MIVHQILHAYHSTTPVEGGKSLLIGYAYHQANFFLTFYLVTYLSKFLPSYKIRKGEMGPSNQTILGLVVDLGNNNGPGSGPVHGTSRGNHCKTS